MKTAKLIILLFGFGTGSRKKEIQFPPIPFTLPNARREEIVRPQPTTLTGNGKMLAFKTPLISLSFKSKGNSHLYDLYMYEISAFSSGFPPGERILRIHMSQGMINEELYKSLRTSHPKKGLMLRTDFQDITWPEQEFGRMYILDVYEQFIKRPRVAKPRKKKETPPSA